MKMKKYKLIKDLPTIRTGVVFMQSEDRDYYCNCVEPRGHQPNVKPHWQIEKEGVEDKPQWFEEIK